MKTNDYILIWPMTLPNGEVVRLDRVYVETKSEWRESMDRCARALGRSVD